jgi:PKD repeat protein
MVALALNIFSDMSVKSDKITQNTISGVSQFKDVHLPQIPKIDILVCDDISLGYWGYWGTKWVEKDCYSRIIVKNKGTNPANVWVVTSFQGDYWYVRDGGKISLSPNEQEIFRIDYVTLEFSNKPKYGQQIQFIIFAENDGDIYLVDDMQRNFYPYPLSEDILSIESTKTHSTENSGIISAKNSGITADSLENVTVISHPIKATLARVNMTTYEVIITAKNPFAYPINAKITQNTTRWNISIPPRERRTLNYTIHPELGVETTIPPAYMEYFDFQYNVTVTFASDAINFTATGIEIKGDLPYEISEYVEVNLSITNLVNVTNGTFCLELIGNETFDYNVTASIENVSTYTAKFGPIDVPEGDYIGISTFVWDDEKSTIDSRNMIKAENEPPIANFTYSPLHPVVNHTVTFNASNSTDLDGNITKYDWDFGDGNVTNTTEEIVNHSYPLAGDYIVNLTVTDNDDATNSSMARITVSSMPDLVITAKWLCWPDNCTICYNVTNTGDGTAPACHNTTLYVDDEEVAHDHVPVDLAPGESYTGCFNGYVWTYTPPSDNITVCADNNESLNELDEDNNCLTNIWMCGDVTGDGRVRTSDGRRIFRHLTFGDPIDNMWAADVTGDGRVRTSDGRRIFRHLTFGDPLNCNCSG